MFTVAVTNYNYSRYLGQCLGSLLGAMGSRKDIEIVVVDDYSTDNSRALLNQFSQVYPSVKVIFNLQNQGVSFSRNVAYSYGTNPWMFYVDGDDWVHPDIFTNLETAIRENPDKRLIQFQDKFYYEDRNEFMTFSHSHPTLAGIFHKIMAGNFCYLRDDFNDVGGFQNEMWEDYFLYARLLSRGDGVRAKGHLINYRKGKPSREQEVTRNLKTYLPELCRKIFTEFPLSCVTGIFKETFMGRGYHFFPEDFDGDFTKFPDLKPDKRRSRPYLKYYSRV